jgi:signal transduction histidine kinase
VLTDVTERRRLELAKLASAEEARAQQELAIGIIPTPNTDIDIICHELRNPLNGIYHNAELVYDSMGRLRYKTETFRSRLPHATLAPSSNESDLLPPFLHDLESEVTQNIDSLEALIQCAKHQNRIADDVLQLSKLSMNLVSLKETPFDPFVETKNSMRMFEREVLVKEIEMKLAVGEGYDALQIGMVRGDPTRFTQVLLNFLSNAIRFTEKAPSRTIEITLDASEAEPILFAPGVLGDDIILTGSPTASRVPQDTIYLISSVSDSGVGITKEEQKRLFHKFTQASPKTHIEYGGSGLGLFISKALVEAHGGKLTLDSEKDIGTKLTFYIRVKRELDEPGQSTATHETNRPARAISPLVPLPQVEAASSEPVGPPRRDSQTILVLVVEDNLVMRFILC